jgi:hypothetical protein
VESSTDLNGSAFDWVLGGLELGLDLLIRRGATVGSASA